MTRAYSRKKNKIPSESSTLGIRNRHNVAISFCQRGWTDAVMITEMGMLDFSIILHANAEQKKATVDTGDCESKGRNHGNDLEKLHRSP